MTVPLDQHVALITIRLVKDGKAVEEELIGVGLTKGLAVREVDKQIKVRSRRHAYTVVKPLRFEKD